MPPRVVSEAAPGGDRRDLRLLRSHGALEPNPAASVRGPKYSARTGKTAVPSDDEVLDLLESIDTAKPARCGTDEWTRVSPVTLPRLSGQRQAVESRATREST
jgi:hypothetical protein